MQIIDFIHEHIEQATLLARASYAEEWARVTVLPQDITIPDLSGFAGNCLGVTAFEQEKMVGFLCCYSPFNNTFGSTKARGVFSPIYGNCSITENRAAIYARMYQTAAKKWARAGASSHAICLYAGNTTVQEQFFRYGFGLRCVDAIRPMDALNVSSYLDIEYTELIGEKRFHLRSLDVLLDEHMATSPTFIRRNTKTEDEFVQEMHESKDRYFAAKSNEEIIAFLKVSDESDNFITGMPDMQSICGAFCLPQYRGKGIFQNLINHAISILKSEGYTRLGVDFESLNPNADRFWNKYFMAYTHSLVRRIDEDALKRGTL
ncbi:GNAT family N-acetyltransferase [Desulfosporosinus meridiei]|uniref:Putative glycosyl hydrolase n=1 Tax=Desulfosporosinus meridiei (strain ATCC BAA-275 / DSM 13257 / KCTC 12902 / NCIMB 13706 / S10) TaxID=768704 RepID=J7IR99_DESMD|nr:GNAT family N-acetyltransferase [Desulfosporosinus meridiei]AFQ44357.1 putative glycosyl hydrolase [Desulfosporosinus meridiei DSM 13257]